MGRGKHLTNEELAVIKHTKIQAYLIGKLQRKLKDLQKWLIITSRLALIIELIREVVANVKLIIVLNKLLYVVLLLSS